MIVSTCIFAIELVLCSIFGRKLRHRPSLYIPIFVMHMAAQSAVLICLNYFIEDSSLVVKFSMLQASCCIALSLYSCCVKNTFTRLWSHIFFAMILAVATGGIIGLNLHLYAALLYCALAVALWCSFITHNAMHLTKIVSAKEGFYAALLIQTDLFFLLRLHCARQQPIKDAGTKSKAQNSEKTL